MTIDSGIMNSIFEAPRIYSPFPPLTPPQLFSDMAPLAAYKDFFTKVTNLTALAKDIPETVPLATKDDEICRIFEKFPLPEQMSEDWEIFNRRMDILFGENVRDGNGRLSNLRRGPYGMDLVIEYLLQVTERGFLLWEAALVKVERIIKEITLLMYIIKSSHDFENLTACNQLGGAQKSR
jgi:hypothetical protein